MKAFFNRLTILFAMLLALCSAATPARAEAPCPCAGMTADQSARKQALFKKLYAYDGCDQTLEKCLAMKKPHFSVRRAAADVCLRIRKNESDKDIEAALEKRAESLMPGLTVAKIARDPRMLVGDPNAPITLSVYACTRCPFCKVLLPALFREVNEGSLEGKVNIQFRLFPIKSHPGALEGGLALEASAALGRFEPFLDIVYRRFDAFSPEKLSPWAAEAGLNRAAFDRLAADPATRTAVVSAKQEGVVNKVSATPTLFINGTRYVYDLNETAVIDLLEEAAQSAAAE